MNIDLIKLDLKTARNKKLLCECAGARDEHGWTPLHAAVAFDNLCRVEKRFDKDNQLLNASNKRRMDAAARCGGPQRQSKSERALVL